MISVLDSWMTPIGRAWKNLFGALFRLRLCQGDDPPAGRHPGLGLSPLALRRRASHRPGRTMGDILRIVRRRDWRGRFGLGCWPFAGSLAQPRGPYRFNESLRASPVAERKFGGSALLTLFLILGIGGMLGELGRYHVWYGQIEEDVFYQSVKSIGPDS